MPKGACDFGGCFACHPGVLCCTNYIRGDARAGCDHRLAASLGRYTGPLCGVCARGYGRLKLVECAKCMPGDTNRGSNAGIIAANVVVILILGGAAGALPSTVRENAQPLGSIADEAEPADWPPLHCRRSLAEQPPSIGRIDCASLRPDCQGTRPCTQCTDLLCASAVCYRPKCALLTELASCAPDAVRSQVFLSYWTVTSLIGRIPVPWPWSLAKLLKLQSVFGNNVEVYSFDCGVGPINHSKVFDRAQGWLIASIIVPMLPGPPLLLWARLHSQARQQARDAALFFQWAGFSARRAAADHLVRLPSELPSVAPPAQEKVVVDGPIPQRELTGRDAEALALISASIGDAHAHAIWSVSPCPSELPGTSSSGAENSSSAAAGGTSTQQRGGGGHDIGSGAGGDEAPLLLSWAERLFELEMSSRCRGADQEEASTSDSAPWELLLRTAACVSFCIWTPAATAILQLFSCIRVEPHPELSPVPSPFHGRWLLQDLSTRCFEGPHLRHVIGVGLPGLAVVVLGIPLLLANAVASRSRQLGEEAVARRFGFLYLGAPERASA